MKKRYSLNNISNNRKKLYLILSVVMLSVLTLTVVYASLSTTLQINGNAEVTAAAWDINFDNIKINQGSVEATTTPTIINSRTINFVVGLKEPGDYYKFTVDIVNNGTIDAMIDSVVKAPTLTETQAKYLKYEIEYTDGNSILDKQLLQKETSKTMSVLVAYRSDVASSDIPTEGESLNLSFTMNYVQADETSTIIPESTPLVRVVNGDINTVGSEICIGTECFYLIENDGKSVTMFAKYNLLVGNKYDDTNHTTKVENPTERQDINAKGWFSEYSETNPIIGTSAFSSTNYWSGSVTKFPSYIYNSSSTIYQYIANYKTYIKEQGITILDARLIKVEELEKLGCSTTNISCNDSKYQWVYSTSYWTGSAHNSKDIWNVGTSKILGAVSYNDSVRLGIRPIIIISMSNF